MHLLVRRDAAATKAGVQPQDRQVLRGPAADGEGREEGTDQGIVEEQGPRLLKRTWFLDTNVLADWVMARGGVIDVLHEHGDLPQAFVEAYVGRHETAVAFMDRVMSRHHGPSDRFYASHLTVNELWKAIKEEATAVLQFQAGTPLSQWREVRNRPRFDETLVKAIYDATIDATIGRLFSHDAVQVVQEANPTDDGYFDVFVPVLFLPEFVMTMDATLITTAIYYDADYFVSRDRGLHDAVNKRLGHRMGLRCISPVEGTRPLRHR